MAVKSPSPHIFEVKEARGKQDDDVVARKDSLLSFVTCRHIPDVRVMTVVVVPEQAR